MNINKYIKPNKYIVIELSDEVEYFMDDSSIKAIVDGKKEIPLIRLIDREKRSIDVSAVEKSLIENGVVDYIDKKL